VRRRALTTFATIFVSNILPVFLVIGVGVLVDRSLHVDKRALSRLAVYVLSPCLLFSLIAESEVEPSGFGRMVLFAVLCTLVMIGVSMLVGRILGWTSRQTDSLVLSTAFVNSGNLGLSVILFTYGEVGVELASAFYVVTNVTSHTLGAFFAARGQGGARQALRRVVRLPGPYAFLLAFGLRQLGWQVLAPLLGSVQLIGRAAFPILLMMLGIQLSQAQVGTRYGEIALGVTLRLVVGSAVAFFLAPLVGLAGMARSVGIVEASTPTAVTSSVMAVEFGSDAEYVTSVIFASTLVSSLTLTLLLAFL